MDQSFASIENRIYALSPIFLIFRINASNFCNIFKFASYSLFLIKDKIKCLKHAPLILMLLLLALPLIPQMSNPLTPLQTFLKNQEHILLISTPIKM